MTRTGSTPPFRVPSSIPNIWCVLALLLHPSLTTTVHADPSAPRPALASATTESASLPPVATPADAASDPFAKGSTYWSVTGAGSLSVSTSLGWIHLTELNVSYYLIDDLAVSCGGIIGYINARQSPGGALGGPDLGLRWHYAKGHRWSTYAEALVGAVFQQHPLAEEGLRFNFDLQPGAGASYQLNDRALLQGGLRWHHLSNARIRGKEHNPSYDGPMMYLQLTRPF